MSTATVEGDDQMKSMLAQLLAGFSAMQTELKELREKVESKKPSADDPATSRAGMHS